MVSLSLRARGGEGLQLIFVLKSMAFKAGGGATAPLALPLYLPLYAYIYIIHAASKSCIIPHDSKRYVADMYQKQVF